MKILKFGVRVSRTRGSILILLSALAGSAVSTNAASAQTLTTIASFNGGNGANPLDGSLIADANGDLFGMTQGGGAFGDGTVFEIAKTAGGYATTPTTLASFDGSDGAFPQAGLIADANGNLFGTTLEGGASGDGTVFEIANTAGVYATTPTTLVSFDGSDGALPIAGLIADANGNLFGTTALGGAFGDGTVFEIANTAGVYATTPTTLVSFNGSDGAFPQAGLIVDASGDLFGTAFQGGDSGDGTVFEIANSASGYATTPTTLVSFNGTDGAFPLAGLITDATGNLFSTTESGGASGDGTVFELAKTASGYAATPTTLVSFNGTDGAALQAGLIADAKGNLFSTAQGGGAFGLGTVFEIAHTASGYATTPITLISFDLSTGSIPLAGLIADANGNLFSTTFQGGASGLGTVFEVTGSGFATPTQFAGTPGNANCHGVTISTLANTFGGVAHAASALGYASVKDLQSAVTAFCGN